MSYISNTLFHTFFCLNFVFYAVVSKILIGMANSVDLDQAAHSGAV